MRSLVLTISLLFAFASTQGQGAMFLRGSQPAPTPGAGILDSYPGAAFVAAPDVLIYSAHSVTDNTVGSQTQGQTGPYTVLVRRDNDDALRSFTHTEVSDGTLTTWVGPANNGFVQILYDQSTNGNHATQTVAANQPKIVDAGSLVVENGKAALNFDGVNGIGITAVFSATYSQPNTIIFVCRKINHNGYLFDGVNSNARHAQGNGDWIFSGIVVFGAYPSSELDKQVLFTTIFNSPASSAYVNNQVTVSSSNSGNLPLSGLGIGTYVSDVSRRLNGKVQAAIVYPSDQSTNRPGIENAINNEYSIY